MKELNCKDCQWKNPETCRACKAGQALAERREWDLDYKAQAAPVARQGMPDWELAKLCGILADAVNAKAWAFDSADAVLLAFVCMLGQEDVHYAMHKADPEEYLEPVYGLQN